MPPEATTLIRPAAPAAVPAAPPETDTLSIVIVSWNTRAVLRDCLESVFARRGGLDVEVIVVDNASSDGTAGMVTRDFPAVRLVRNADNRGFAAANNQGMAIARGRYVLLLNPDTVVLDDVLERTIEWADARPDVAVTGCQVMESATTVQRTCFRDPGPLHTFLWLTGLGGRFPRSRLAGRAAYGPWARDAEREVDVVSGMFMLVRRDALEQVGMMDERYFVFAEEADWCFRFRRAGWRCVFAPVGRILHVDGGSKSTEQVSVKMFVQMQKNTLLFHRANLGPVRWALSRAMFSVAMPLRAAWWLARARLGGGGAARHKAVQSLAATRFLWTGAEPDR